jgi:hypothetical protein
LSSVKSLPHSGRHYRRRTAEARPSANCPGASCRTHHSPPPPGLFCLAACIIKASKLFKKQYANCTRQESHAIVFAFVSPFRPPCPQRQAARALRIIADSKVIKIQQTEL